MATPVKFIQITKLPKRSTLLFDGDAVALNDRIDVADQALITLENPTGYKGLPFDFFGYKIVDSNDNESKEAQVQIDFPTSGTMAAIVTGDTIDTPGVELYFDDYVAYDISWDRIIINSILGKGQWLLGKRSDGTQIFFDEPLMEGRVYMCYDIHNLLRFVASEEGSLPIYSQIIFQKANQKDIDTVSNFIIKSLFLGIQETVNEPNAYVDDNGDYHLFFETQVHKSIEDAVANVSVDTTSFSQLTADPENYIQIGNGTGLDETITTLAVPDFPVQLDKDGKAMLNFHVFLKGTTGTVEPIIVNLEKINTDTMLVDPSNVPLTFNSIAL